VAAVYVFNMAKLISDIQTQKKDPKRVNVYLDGEFAFGVSKVVAAWLKIGQMLPEEKIESLRNEEEIETAYLKSLHFVSYRPRTTFEIRKNLLGKDYPEPIIDAVLERLSENHLVDDLEFARNWIANRQELHPRSQLILTLELRRKGISDELIQKPWKEILMMNRLPTWQPENTCTELKTWKD